MTNIKNFAINSTPQMEEQIKEFTNSRAYQNQKIRIMPDGHSGKGCVVGSTMTFSDKIVPNTIGVDIACRVSLYSLGINVVDLPEGFFEKFDKMVEDRIPTGFNVRGSEAEESKTFPYKKLKCYKALQNIQRVRNSMGSLGGGNHYLELDVDEDLDIYLSIHCGSRNLGKQVCDYYQGWGIRLRDQMKEAYKITKEAAIEKHLQSGKVELIPYVIQNYKDKIASLPKDDLCYITGTIARDYLDDMRLCNEWSKLNHDVIYHEIMEGLKEIINDN